MELMIWLSAIAMGVVVLIAALAFLTVRTVSVAKKLRPFAERIKRFQMDATKYPEAIKFYSDLSKGQNPPAKDSGKPKG